MASICCCSGSVKFIVERAALDEMRLCFVQFDNDEFCSRAVCRRAMTVVLFLVFVRRKGTSCHRLYDSTASVDRGFVD